MFENVFSQWGQIIVVMSADLQKRFEARSLRCTATHRALGVLNIAYVTF